MIQHLPLDLIPLMHGCRVREREALAVPSFAILMKQKKLKRFDPCHQKKGKIRQRLGSATATHRPRAGGVGNFPPFSLEAILSRLDELPTTDGENLMTLHSDPLALSGAQRRPT